jgi:stage II sporulation protein E
LAPAYLLAVAVAGLSSVKVGPAHIQNVVGGLALLSFAWVGGPGIGAAAGVVVGSIDAQGQLLYPPMMGKLALAGLAAGYARRFGRWGTAAGFLAANLALTYYLLEPSGVTAALWETIGAVLAFLAVPTGLLEGVTSLWGEELQQFTPTVERANQNGPPPEARTEEQLSEVAERLHQFSGVFEELSRSFEEVSPAREEQGTTHDKLIELAVSRACRECRFFERCWEDRFYHTYQGVLDLLTELELGAELNKHRVLDKVDSCHRAKRLGMELAQAYEYRLLEQRWAGRVDETRGIVATQLHGASEVMKELALEVEQQEQNRPVLQAVSGKPRLSHVMGVSRRAKQEGSVSGDSYLVRELPDGRWAFMLSDGMGAGPKASRESKTTIDLLYRLLEAGFSPEVAVKTINSVLLFRSAEDVFATIDLVLFDVHNSTGEFVKVGAAPSFLKRGTRVTNIDARTLPVGILNDIEVEVYHRALRPGDVLVMLTDGILNSQGKGISDRWVKRFLRSCSVDDVQQVARSLVKRAQQFSGPELVDDLTALVFKFE